MKKKKNEPMNLDVQIRTRFQNEEKDKRTYELVIANKGACVSK
jgi:hypothetical protein